MKEWMFSFSVTVADFDSIPATYKRYNGLGFADSYADAAASLEAAYGNDLIIINHLELAEDYGANLVLLPPDTIHAAIRGDNWDTGIPCDVDGNPLEEV